jgi:signal transduction histidine kinase
LDTPNANYDQPWKEAIEYYLEPFLTFFFPEVHTLIDWNRDYQSLDKELQQVEEFSALALSSRVKLTAEIPTTHSIVVMGDIHQLYRLVSNLVVNAIRYTPSEGAVSLRLDRESELGQGSVFIVKLPLRD